MNSADTPPAVGSKTTNGLSRRKFLRAGATAGALSMAAPLYIRRAMASSGELNILCWSQEIPQDVVDAFTAKTGITVNLTPFSSNEELVNKLQATYGEGFDLCMPSFNRAPEFQFLEMLAPIDTNQIKMDAFVPSLLLASTDLWTWDGKLYHLPHVWGSEGMSWRTDKANLTYDDMSYGLLWDTPEYAGKVQMRPTSGLLGLGLWMDAQGKLPSNRMMDTYKDEETMRKIYDEILAYAVAHKSGVKQFWDSSDSTRSGYMDNGCVIGQTWDGPALGLAKQDKPVSYMAPKEGALAWIDGFSVTNAAKNTEQMYAFMDFLLSPEIGGKVAIGSHNNSAVKGADAFVPEIDKTLFAASYPGNAIENLWRYPASPSWFTTARNEYAEKFKVA